jgi:branched-chain amino acid transport system permease protein
MSVLVGRLRASLGVDRWRALPVSRRRQILTPVLLVIGLLFPFASGNAGNVDAAANAFTYVLLALGLNIVVGFAGLLDLGYAAFFAIGAYGYGIAASGQLKPAWSSLWAPLEWAGQVTRLVVPGQADTVQFHFAFWPMLAISAIICAIFGLLFGAPTLRLRGDYLAIVTLGFGEIIPQAVNNGDDVFGHNVTNGPNGLTPIDQLGFGTSIHNAVSFLPANYHNELSYLDYYYWTGLALVLFTLFCCIRLRDSRLGRAWVAIREDEIAAAAMGVPLMRTKTWAYAIGAFFGGLAGCFYAIEKNSTFPGDFSLNISIFVLCMVILGGMGNVWGVMLGAVVLTYLNYQGLAAIGRQLNIDISTYSYGFFGGIIVIMMLLRPEGLIPSRRRRVEFRAAAEGLDVGQSVAEHE